MQPAPSAVCLPRLSQISDPLRPLHHHTHLTRSQPRDALVGAFRKLGRRVARAFRRPEGFYNSRSSRAHGGSFASPGLAADQLLVSRCKNVTEHLRSSWA